MHDRRVQPWSVAQCEDEEKRKKGKGRGEKSLKTVKTETGRWLWSFSRVTWLSSCWTCINGEASFQ